MQADILAFQANSEPHAQSGAVRLVVWVAVTFSSYSQIVPQVSYRTPMGQASFQRLAQNSPPFPGKRSA